MRNMPFLWSPFCFLHLSRKQSRQGKMRGLFGFFYGVILKWKKMEEKFKPEGDMYNKTAPKQEPRKPKGDPNSFPQRVAALKKESPYYPDVIIREYEGKCPDFNEMYISTLVRIKRNDVWCTVHCVESGSITEYLTVKDLLTRIQHSAYKIEHLHRICGLEDIDGSQKSEEDRLKYKE